MEGGVPLIGDARLDFMPTSLYCYMVGREAIRGPFSDTGT